MNIVDNTMSGNRQCGAVLIISLIFLLLMTIIGVTSIQTSTLQERMAGNVRDHNRALQAAEMALRTGEVWLDNNWATADTTPPLDIYDWVAASDWSSLSQAPQVVLTHMGDPNKAGFFVHEPEQVIHGITASSMTVENYYPVTARGVGGNDATVVVLHSRFKIIQ